MRYIFSLLMPFLITSNVFGQKVVPDEVYPSALQRSIRPQASPALVNRNKGLLPLQGYTYELYDQQENRFNLHHSRTFSYASPAIARLDWITASGDQVMKTNLQLAPGADNHDLLKILLPGVMHESFLRFAPDVNRAILSNETLEKQSGSWITVSRTRDRI